MNGCPNSCAQHWQADIGLRGMRRECASGSEEGFQVSVGGALYGPGHIAKAVCEVSAAAVVPVVRRMLELYLEHRNGEAESFGEFSRRIGPQRYADLLGVPPAPEEAVGTRDTRLQPIFQQAVLDTNPW